MTKYRKGPQRGAYKGPQRTYKNTNIATADPLKCKVMIHANCHI